MPARRRRRHRAARRAHRPAGPAARSGATASKARARVAVIDEALVHRLHAVHPGLPGRCDRRRGQADAHRDRRRCAPAASCACRACPVDCIAMIGAPASAPAGTPGAARAGRRGARAPRFARLRLRATRRRTTRGWRPRPRPSSRSAASIRRARPTRAQARDHRGAIARTRRGATGTMKTAHESTPDIFARLRARQSAIRRPSSNTRRRSSCWSP